MSTNADNLPEADEPSGVPRGPGAGPMKPVWIVAVAAYLVVVSVLVLYGLIKLWPYPTPSGQTPPADQVAGSQLPANNQGNAQNGNSTGTKKVKEIPDPELIKFFGRPVEVYLETRLLLLVMLAGALGSLMHALRSLYWYTGNREMVWSWVAFYLLLPLTGAILATIFYFVVRGGFFSSQASFEYTSPFGFAALSALVGLFSPQATLKLKEIAETIFAKPPAGSDTRPQESSSVPPTTGAVPTIASVTPASAAANESIVIAGTNFSAGAVVKFGGVAATVSSASDTSITVLAPANPAATGPVDVEVTNSDGQSATSSQAFTYVAGGTADTAAIDELDGHNEIKSNTTDEELPITEGGVE